MILSDSTIKEYIAAGKIIILPEFRAEDVRPAGVRLHLAADLLVPRPGQTIDIAARQDPDFDKITMDENGYVLKPGAFVLGSTSELYRVPRNMVCTIDGRSSIARVGLAIYCTSQVADGNYEEPATTVLEIHNVGPFNIVLKPQAPVGMLVFHELTDGIAQDIQAVYRGQTTVTPPHLNADNASNLLKSTDENKSTNVY